MKKIIALTAVVALFSGCDSAGYEGPPIAFSNVTVTEVDSSLAAPVVEIQDIAGRQYFHAAVTTGVGLGGFELAAGDRDMFVVLLDGEEFIGFAGFRAAELTADPTFEVRTLEGALVGRVMLDVATL